jgi:hypothetical protein
VVRREFTIQKPDGLAPGAKFDAHISVCPINQVVASSSQICKQNVVTSFVADTSFVEGYGLLTVRTTPTNNNTFIDQSTQSAPVASTPLISAGLGLTTITKAAGDGYDSTQDFCTGLHRVVGGAFEAHNDSSVLIQSGSVTVYSFDQTAQNINFLWPDAATHNLGTVVGSCQTNRLPPANIKAAALLPNSRTWAAKEGCYVVFKPSRRDLEWKSCVPANMAMLGGEAQAGNFYGPADPDGVIDFVGLNDAFSTGAGTTAPSSISTNSMACSGAYFTGLHEDTTIKLVVKFLLERAPAPTNELVTLSRPAMRADPGLWPILSAATRLLPPGVPVSENFTGKFFKGAIDTVKTVVNSPLGELALDAVHEHGGPKASAAAALTRAHFADQRASTLQHNAAMERESAGVPPRLAGDGKIGSKSSRRAEKMRRKRARREHLRQIRAISSRRW